MNFTSSTFLYLFFPFAVALYVACYFVQQRCRAIKKYRITDVILFLLSLLFYCWVFKKGIKFIFVYITAVFCAGWLIQAIHSNDSKKVVIVSSIILLIVVFYYKYLLVTCRIAGNLLGKPLLKDKSILAPLGISFITFSALSYLIDVYRQEANAGNWLDVALYITFFPKVISGPIERFKDFMPQYATKRIEINSFIEGINRVIIGLAKKVILADSFGAVIATMPVKNLNCIDVPTTWLFAILYMLEIYYDFAGYSDIAIGLSAMFGFNLKENFDFPYISTSITEFWRRWHVSLGSWFREYVYIPLGGNRKGFVRTLFNIAVVFVLTGYWHGATFGYLFWGIVHGSCVIVERCVNGTPVYENTPKFVKWFITMAIVMFGWLFFYWGSFKDTVNFIKFMFGNSNSQFVEFTYMYYLDKRLICLLMIAIFGATLMYRSTKYFREKMGRNLCGVYAFMLKELALLLLFVLIQICIVNSTYSPFIYFQY